MIVLAIISLTSESINKIYSYKYIQDTGDKNIYNYLKEMSAIPIMLFLYLLSRGSMNLSLIPVVLVLLLNKIVITKSYSRAMELSKCATVTESIFMLWLIPITVCDLILFKEYDTKTILLIWILLAIFFIVNIRNKKEYYKFSLEEVMVLLTVMFSSALEPVLIRVNGQYLGNDIYIMMCLVFVGVASYYRISARRDTIKDKINKTMIIILVYQTIANVTYYLACNYINPLVVESVYSLELVVTYLVYHFVHKEKITSKHVFNMIIILLIVMLSVIKNNA